MINKIKHSLLLGISSVFILFNLACSSDDNETKTDPIDDVKTKLELTVDKNTGKVGTSFEFTVKANGAIVEGVKIELIGKYPLEKNTWVALEEGEFLFKATKVGFKESNIIKVNIKNPSLFTYDGKEYTLNSLRFNFKTPYAYGPYIYDIYNMILKSEDNKNTIEIQVAFLREDNNAIINPFAHQVEFAKWAEATFIVNGQKLNEVINMESKTFINIKKLDAFDDLGDYKYLSPVTEIDFLFQFESGKELKGEYFGKASLDFVRE